MLAPFCPGERSSFRIIGATCGCFATRDSLEKGRSLLPFRQRKQSHVRQPQQPIALSFEPLAQFSRFIRSVLLETSSTSTLLLYIYVSFISILSLSLSSLWGYHWLSVSSRSPSFSPSSAESRYRRRRAFLRWSFDLEMCRRYNVISGRSCWNR